MEYHLCDRWNSTQTLDLIRWPGDREVAGSLFAISNDGAPVDLCGAEEAELLQGRYAIVKTDFLEDLSVPEFQHGRAGEFHLATGVGR